LEQELLVKYLRPGAVFYDVGANAGFYAIIGARAVGPAGQVYAFEPMPKLVERIRENVALNSQTNVTVIEAAVSDRDGVTAFAAQGSLSMLSSIRAVGKSADTISVPTLRLDTFSREHRPDLILMDIEGDEIQALNGALQTIAKCRPVLMIEIHYVGSAFVDLYERELKPLGYVGSTYDGEPLRTEKVHYHALLRPS
jgi:FkbM family methyltransferase